ncbi:MAG: pseudaminic acid synthase [Comamonadaceae bacterium]|nr:pseudaminic acid synthase [Comamonadaceae bacterium]
MTLDVDEGEFFIADPNSLWQGASLHQLYQKAHTPWEWHEPIFRRAKELGMLAFSTPFDESAVDFLESLDVPCYKIASFESTDLPLIRKVAATGKPMIVSTGMASLAELEGMVACAREAELPRSGAAQVHQHLPGNAGEQQHPDDPHLRELFGTEVGLSDHTMGTGVAVAAVALGASVVEKHFTLARADGGVDSSFSLEPAELAALVVETERAWQGLGRVRYGTQSAQEEKSKVYRRSLYVVRDVAEGETLDASAVRAIRPGLGLAPKHLEAVIGRRARRAIRRGTPLAWELID